ncbi:MAG: hypothetical protein JSU00_18530 [Acidobacteria bacterium]|nr:hypothetical protein [Acidobacteriota bacterium]
MDRRSFLTTTAVAAAQPKAAAPRLTHLCLNEDNSHWFFTRAGQPQTAETISAFIDQYANTQVREILLSANSQRTSFASKVWDPIWKGYDPKGPDDQPLFQSTAREARPNARKWVDTAWRLAEQGIDPYQLWIARARQKGLEPWISMRMNDLHNVDDPASYMHSTYWREHPDQRRVPWRFADTRDRALDFGHPEVRAYHLQLVREYIDRYDLAGLELDWMRFGFHCAPGQEAETGRHITEFVRETRRLLDRKNRRLRLGVRVPSRPQAAIELGMDGAQWAREGIIDMLVVTPFWASIDTDIPIELWRRLAGDKVTLAAGLELLIRPYHAYRPLQFNSIETVRGVASSLLSRGADRIYLFNYMDSQTEMPDRENYPALLRECGRLDTLAGKPRRHIVTYPDTQAPGEPTSEQLPRSLQPKQWATFRLHCGPAIQKPRLRLGIEGEAPAEVRVNGTPCQPSGRDEDLKPGPKEPVHAWTVPQAVQARAVVDVQARAPLTIHWVEVASST